MHCRGFIRFALFASGLCAFPLIACPGQDKEDANLSFRFRRFHGQSREVAGEVWEQALAWLRRERRKDPLPKLRRLSCHGWLCQLEHALNVLTGMRLADFLGDPPPALVNHARRAPRRGRLQRPAAEPQP